MNKLWNLIFGLLFSQLIVAQTSGKIESLFKTSVGKTAHCLRIADSLNGLKQSDDAIWFSNKALTLQEVKNNQKNSAFLFLVLGSSYDQKQEYRKALGYYNQAYAIFKNLKDTALLVRNYTGLSGVCSDLEKKDSALFFLNKGLELAELNKKKYANYIIRLYNNLGLIYNEFFNFPEALKNFLKAVDACEKVKDLEGLSRTYNNMGNLYADIGDQEKSLSCYKKSIALRPSSQTLANIGILYSDKEQNDSALVYIKQSILMDIERNDKEGLSGSYTVVGNIFKKKLQYDSAMFYYHLSSKLANEIEDIGVVQNNNYNIVELLIAQKKYQEAKPIAHQNLTSLLDGSDMEFISDVYSQLKVIYSELGDYKKAFEYQSQNMLYKDSALQANKTIEIKKIELNAEYKKKSSNDSLLHAQATLVNNLKHEEEIQKQRFLLLGFIIILVIVAMFSIMIYKRYKISVRQKEIINLQKNEMYHQKLLVEEKQKEILDSIHYAKRIQDALIAHRDFVNEHIPHNFIYFNPKDIVSGDFYWATKHGDCFYLALCDSTGHGVPGAFMSLLNIGFLSEAIKEKNITSPDKVFNYVRERLTESISKEGQKDGFDGVLMCFDKTHGTITYAAANVCPVLIRNNTLIEQSMDRMPVGVSELKADFKLHTMDVQPGDYLYLYTDGYADQFGGPKGKKFKYRALNEFLLTHHNKPLNEQQEILTSTFDNWRGSLEQVDDVCVIGIKF